MQNPGTAYQFKTMRSPSQRYAGIAFVITLHVALIWALINGLGVTIVKHIQRDIQTRVIDTQPKTKPQPPQPLPKPPVVHVPKVDTMPPPIIHIDNTSASRLQVTAAPAPADTSAKAVGSTHSIPPYPPIARRLGHEGSVELRLTISPDGRVVKADVVHSSGWSELDNEAASWIVAHWRYTPAMRGGMAVASTTTAVVKFDLKDARG